METATERTTDVEPDAVVGVTDPHSPLRGELFGLEGLEQHARHLAHSARLMPRPFADRRLFQRFRENGRELTRVYHRIVDATRAGQPVSTDAEWLFDNFHIVEDTLREVKHDLPRGYYQRLPKLADGPYAGLPRVYALGIELIAHTDSCLDEANITHFVRAYQSVTPLTIGELWAIAIMLRVGLIENLRCLSHQMLNTWGERDKAEQWVRQLIPPGANEDAAPPPPAILPQHERDWSDPLMLRLLQGLREHGPLAAMAVEWLEKVLERRGDNATELSRREYQRQAANQVSVGNCVTSLRLLSNLDWTTFFENVSLVEQILQGDPARVYGRQDATTRDRYRRAVERLARGSKADEFAVARHAVRLAEEHAGGATVEPTASADLRAKAHIGYYLVDRGVADLESAIQYRPQVGLIAGRWVAAHPGMAYFGFLAAVWGALVAVALWYAGAHAGWSTGWMALAAFAVALPASELAAGLANDFFTRHVAPRVLSKLESRERLPADCPTFVVIPTLLLHPESGPALAERLEIHYLSNNEPQFRFALLTDFSDATAEHEPGDQQCLDAALAAIRALNERYGNGDGDRFFLFHRRRQWNPAQNCWMGWERKRGKLAEFNRLLRGDKETSFTVQSGGLDRLPHTRFVITLDTDTQLPREMGRRLVATLAHPLNQPRFDPAARRVVAGYGVLQPRVSFSLRSALRSRFARLMASSAGIDPYSTAVSDVYQDLFAIGSFTGKGIYDVDAFEAAASHAFPENSILSHDLIEGNYARCGLVTDIEFLDEFPPQYHAYARREHRWARGDWQILPWLFPLVSTVTGRRERNPLPMVERWKIFDNLRRSLVPPALLLLLTLGWTALPGGAWFWTALALATPLLPCLLLVVNSARGIVHQLARGGEIALLLHDTRDRLLATAGQAATSIAFLADQAASLVDAIARTLVRVFFTHRKLLEWETAASAEGRLGNHLGGFLRTMWPAMLIAVALLVLVGSVHPAALYVAAPILIAWGASPLLAYWVSGRSEVKEIVLTPAERDEFRRIARKTWEFFETHVGDQDNWLPLDNFQESPKAKPAHRTSPTNIGLYALSALAAHDLGFLSTTSLCERLEKCCDTLDRLDRFHGHFHNWYDTQSLRVLLPDYVSSVDSGNLLGCLLALAHGLAEKADAKWDWTSGATGLGDTFRLVDEAAGRFDAPPAGTPQLFQKLQETLAELRSKLSATPQTLEAWESWRSSVEISAAQLVDEGHEIETTLGEPLIEFGRWALRLLQMAREFGAETPHADAAPSAAEIAARNGQPPDENKATSPKPRATLNDRLSRLRDRAIDYASAMDFRVLYNPGRDLFSVGYNLSVGRLDTAHYDLLASESCLTSFLAIARGDAPKRHWLQLGRPLTQAAGGIALVSWGGTMFEYLMPRLLLGARPGTLLNESWHGAVDRQIDYGNQRHVPWGISESGFNRLDPSLDYQYQSFGVPGLGLKRGLGRDLVISPYSTALAVSMRPRQALENFRRLTAEGGEGSLGYYEAIDYTRDRLPKDRRSSVVQSYMAHHQGMSLVAIANCLLDDVMPRRLAREPMVKATDLLLEERMPHAAPLIQPDEEQVGSPLVVREESLPKSRRLRSVDTPHPRIHLYSNGHYSVMITAAGGGSSTCDGIDATRWKEDATCDAWGQFCYIQDLTSGLLWSTGHQPICRRVDYYEVTFSTDKAELRRRDGDVETLLEVTVSPESPVEVRRVTLTNHDNLPHEIQLTSYAEIALAPRGADAAHPAFSKLFIETEYVPSERAILCRRRPRAASDKPLWAVHVVAVDGPTSSEGEHETDRKRFLGRGRTAANPGAIEPGERLSGTTGPVLDPIVSLRERVVVAPGASFSVAFSTGVVATREEALTLADQYHDFHAVTRAFELAWAQSQVQLRQLTITDDDVHLFQRLAAHVVFAGNALSANPDVLAANRMGQSGLWRFGISGDKPIVLVHIGPTDDLSLVRQLLLAHGYWRLLGFSVDLVILNEHPGGYFEDVQRELQELVRASESHDLLDKPGGVFLRKGAELSPEDALLLQAAARVVLASNRGTLARQIDRASPSPLFPPPLIPTFSVRPGSPATPSEARELTFANGHGGFSADGREYVIVRGVAPLEKSGLDAGDSTQRATDGRESAALTPAPWVNVVANPRFGTIVSEAGGGYTWNANSQLNRLTTWSNDPVSDLPSEIIYLRDDATAEVWTTTPAPRGDTATTVRHGLGYTQFESHSHGLDQELLVFVPVDDPLKIVRLTLRNRGHAPRRISVASYTEWVLGTLRERARLHVTTEIDRESEALFATNAFRDEFSGGVAFVDVNLRPRTMSGDRTEFIGRNGSLAHPAALRRMALSDRAGAGLDPCAAVMVSFDLAAGEEKSMHFLLGEGQDRDEARQLVLKYRDPAEVARSLDAVRQRWRDLLSVVEVKTPDASFDLMHNGWLLYQVLSCRLWGRTGFYQSGGAYGFRDQLQDCMALVYAAPAETRQHLLRAASRQFLAGDVQHWWHPPSGRGVRTRCSDDFLWLPFAAMQYTQRTGDSTIWDEQVPFLEAAELAPGQDEDYGQPKVSTQTGTLYDHCARAVERGFQFGSHGLPLIASGDWNDGMNRVGAEGRGESVWNAWFQLAILRPFAELARLRGDTQRADHALEVSQKLRRAVEEHGWDGEWYLRAFFDDGTPLGTAKGSACQIDSIVQSWAVLSGGDENEQARQGMDKVQELLVRQQERMILLFTPPFNHDSLDPGYIKGYVPGIRENGGQYTHAATWVVQAAAMLGQGDRAVELFGFLNPIHHGDTAAHVDEYQIEPYAVAGDVYGEQPHRGRGGWSWYTGAAGWLYRVGLESILGFQLQGDRLRIVPCVASHWPEYRIKYRYRTATYDIHVTNSRGVQAGVRSCTVDGQPQPAEILLQDDGQSHVVEIEM